MRNIVASLAALMSASLFVQLSNSAMTTLIALKLAAGGQAESDVGIISAAYAAGFVVGCFAAPRQILRVGLIRGFAAAAAVCTISAIILDLTDDVGQNVIIWSILRFSMGAAIAAMLTISDSWINERSSDETRGRVIAIYALLIGIGSIASQLIFFVVDAAVEGFISALAIMFNISVVVICIAGARAPALETPNSSATWTLEISSPTAAAAAFAHGFIVMSIISIVPFYLANKGVPNELVAMLVASFFAGRLILQWPIGWWSDRIDRRVILVTLSMAITAIFLIMLFFAPGEGKAVSGAAGIPFQYLAFGIFVLLGGFSLPIYSVALSLAFDRATHHSRLHVATTMLFFYATGSIAGPLTVASGVAFFGDDSLLVCAIAASVALLAFTVFRKAMVSAPTDRVAAIPDAPVSSLAISEAIEEMVSEEEAQ